MRLYVAITVCVALAGCSEEMAQRMEEENKPRVIALNQSSVKISQHGNALVNRDPLPETVALAEETCGSMGKTARFSSTTIPDDSGKSMFDPEYMRNHQFFICS
mgnify:CR=1 FL=1